MECSLYLTDYCNLECSYCYQGDEKNATFLNRENLEKALKFIVDNNADNDIINLTFLGGEPLLNKNLIYEAIEIITNNYPKYKDLFKYRITTNCTLLDDNIIRLFKENQFSVRLSIDGDEETHNLNRVSKNNKHSYGDILNNIRKIQNSDISHSIRMTVTDNTINSLYKNIVYFYDLGFKSCGIGIDYSGKWDEIKLSQMETQLMMIAEFYINKLKNNEDINIDIFDGKFTKMIVKGENLFCSAGTTNHLIIKSNGNLYPCGFVANDEKWLIGNISDGLDRKKMINSIKCSIHKNIQCDGCDIKTVCAARKCGFLNYSQTKYLNKPSDNTCKIEEILYKVNKFVLQSLYKSQNKKVMNLINIAKEYNLELNETMIH